MKNAQETETAISTLTHVIKEIGNRKNTITMEIRIHITAPAQEAAADGELTNKRSAAAHKAWATRRAQTKQATQNGKPTKVTADLKQKRSNAAHKAWATRRAQAKN